MADLESRVGKRWDLEVPIWHGSGKNLFSSKWLWDSFQLPQKSEHKQDEKNKTKQNTEQNNPSYYLSSGQPQLHIKSFLILLFLSYPKEILLKYKSSNANIPHHFDYFTGVCF